MLQAGAVHVVVTSHAMGRLVRFTVDSSASSGDQRVTLGAARAEVRVIGHVTYFTGNRQAITDFFGMPASSVPPKGVWYRLTPGDQQYKTVTEGVTLTSALDELGLKGKLTVLPLSRRHGESVVGVRKIQTDGSPIKTVTTLWVAATGPALPVEYDDSEGPIDATIVFGNWGHPAPVVKPTHVRALPTGAAGVSPQADAQMEANLRNVATAEETYLTDAPTSYAKADQLKRQDISFVKLAPGQSIAFHLDGARGYCLAGLVTSGRYFVYSSEEGGLSGPTASDTCSPSRYPQPAGVLR